MPSGDAYTQSPLDVVMISLLREKRTRNFSRTKTPLRGQRTAAETPAIAGREH